MDWSGMQLGMIILTILKRELKNLKANLTFSRKTPEICFTMMFFTL